MQQRPRTHSVLSKKNLYHRLAISTSKTINFIFNSIACVNVLAGAKIIIIISIIIIFKTNINIPSAAFRQNPRYYYSFHHPFTRQTRATLQRVPYRADKSSSIASVIQGRQVQLCSGCCTEQIRAALQRVPFIADKSSSIAGTVQGRGKIFKPTLFCIANQSVDPVFSNSPYQQSKVKYCQRWQVLLL